MDENFMVLGEFKTLVKAQYNDCIYKKIEFEGYMHDALCDAKNTAELFAIVRNEERCKVVLQAVMDVLKPKNVSSTLGDLFDFGALMAQLA